ncbi:MAG: hypothetical protein PF689_04100 [Deltaproteobacteria bacterium]|jgi:hypothetical protein|nr:hypothetical protein [Deltaproteobacteria bacterium]
MKFKILLLITFLGITPHKILAKPAGESKDVSNSETSQTNNNEESNGDNIDLTKNLKAKGVKVISNKITPPIHSKNYEDTTPYEPSEQARAIFRKANKNFEDRELSGAVVNYKKAYKAWPHPRILFNLGVTYSMLSQTLAAANTFKKVLEYGSEPIGELRYKEAREKYLQLMGTLSIIKIKCDQSGPKIYIDGTLITTCPKNRTLTLNSGRHLITAKNKGYISITQDMVLPPGTVSQKNIKLKKYEQLIKYKQVQRIHPRWPAISGAVAALLIGAGSYLIYKGRSDIDNIQDDILRRFGETGGDSFEYDTGPEENAILYQNLGAGALSVGVTSAITATVLYLYRNKRVAVKYTPDEEESNTTDQNASE